MIDLIVVLQLFLVGIFFLDYFGKSAKLSIYISFIFALVIFFQVTEVFWLVSVKRVAFNTNISLQMLSLFIMLTAHYFKTRFKMRTLVLILLPLSLIFHLLSHLGFYQNKILMPVVLSSYVLYLHIIFLILAYLFFTVSAVVATIYLIQYYKLKKKKDMEFNLFRMPSLGSLSNLSHVSTKWGFLFLTFGLVLGSYWQKHITGVFLQKDLKIIVTIFIWLMFILYFHYKINYSGHVKRRLVIIILAYIIMIGSYLLINHNWGV